MYQKGTHYGFDVENIISSLQDIARVLWATGYHGNAHNDYNWHDFDHSWRMNEIFDDIMFGMQKGVHISPHHLSETIKGLNQV